MMFLLNNTVKPLEQRQRTYKSQICGVCMCVCVCVYVFRQLEMYLVKMKEFKKKNRSDLVQFDLSVVIRHLPRVHSILVNL